VKKAVRDASCQVALERPRQLEGVNRLDKPLEDVLQDILRLLCPAQQARRQRQQIGFAAVVDPPQGPFAAPFDCPHKVSIFEHHHW